MTTPNNFNEYYKTISNTELLDILENQESYQPLAVDAAKTEFENRQLPDQEISEAKEPLIAKQLENEKQKDKAKAIEDRVKNVGNSLVDTLKPIQKETPSTDKLIRIITLVFGGLFIYQIISDYRMLTLMIKDIARFDFSSFLYFLPLVVLSTATFTFWKRKTIGWIILSFFLTYSAFGALWGIWESITRKSSGLAGFDNLFPRPSPMTYIIQLCFLGGTLYILSKPNIREVFKIEKQKMITTILVSGFLTLVLMFAIS